MKIDINKLRFILEEPQESFEARVIQVGNSYAALIPSNIMKKLGLKKSSPVEIVIYPKDYEAKKLFEIVEQKLKLFPDKERYSFWSYVNPFVYENVLSPEDKKKAKETYLRIKKQLEKNSSTEAEE